MNTTLMLFLLGSFDLFIPGLRDEYHFLRTERALELNHEIRVRPLGPISRVMSPDAIATYNGNLNTIGLNKVHLRGNVIKPIQEIMGERMNYAPISTIFHEMGHAEMDVFIENETTEIDALLKYHYDHRLKAAYKKYLPKFNPKTVFHEHFGYYRAELIIFLSEKMNDLLTYNGYNKFKKSCFLTAPLRKMLAENVSLEDFQKLIVPPGEDPFFRTRIGTRYVFVRGKDVDLGLLPKEIVTQTHDLFWTYHQEFYGFPMNEKDLIGRMNARAPFKSDLAACRAKLWDAN